MTRHWSWQIAPEHYARLFGEVAAALAKQLDGSHVLLTASCVDDEELEQELRFAGWNVDPPHRGKRWFVTTSHGSLNAWRVVPRDEAATTAEPLWRGVTLARAYSLDREVSLHDWAEVEAFTEAEQRPRVESYDADRVTAEVPGQAEIENQLIGEASVAAERAGGQIRELGRRTRRS